jgi:hypothetical protein
LEGQRVRLLTEGYLRGWLTFDYPCHSSYVREEIILSYIEDERLYALLHNRFFMETVLRSTVTSKDKNFLSPVFSVADELIGLKLPSLKAKDKIRTKAAQDDPGVIPYTQEQMDEWKKIVAELNKDNGS